MPTRFTGRVPRLGSKSGVLNPVGVLPLDWLLCAAERNASLSQRRPGRDPETGAGAHFGFRGGPASAHGLLWSWRAPYFGTILSDHSHLGAREWGMFGYPMRRVPRQCPSDDQRKFLELLRDLGPRDNGQTAAVRKATKRACQVRGWVEWRSPDNSPNVRAWHLTIIGRKVLNSPARRVDSGAPAPLPIDL
jgi:hypothetical protein